MRRWHNILSAGVPAQVTAERIAIIELDHDRLLERCSIYLDGLSPYIMESDQPAESRAGLAAAAWHVTKLSWSPDASHIIVIRRPDPTQVRLAFLSLIFV